MCMLLGFNSDTRYELKSVLKNFFDRSVDHPHGWGLAMYNKSDKCPLIVKESLPAYKSDFVKNMCSHSITGKLAIAHIRFKTYGNVSFENTHPFVKRLKGQEWVLAHNGSVGAPQLKKTLRIPEGDTDSEKILCYIADKLDKLPNGASLEEKTICIEKAVYLLSQYGKLNLLITDGQHLFVHSNCPNTLRMYEHEKGTVLFCTKDIIKGKWSNVPLNSLLVYKDGVRIYKGHAHEFSHRIQPLTNVSNDSFKNFWRW